MIHISNPNLSTVIITSVSYGCLKLMLDCVKFVEPIKSQAENIAKYAALGFGALSLLEFDNFYIAKHSIIRDKIDSLCMQKPPHNIDTYQKELVGKICADNDQNLLHDLKMLCTLMGDNQELCGSTENI